MACHLLHCPYRLEACVQAMANSDVLILLDRAIFLAQAPLPCELKPRVYALAEDLEIAGLNAETLHASIQALSYKDWVALSVEHPQHLVWN